MFYSVAQLLEAEKQILFIVIFITEIKRLNN